MRGKSTINDKYFATIEDKDELASAIQNKIRIWRVWAAERGLLSLWAKKLKMYYGISSGGYTSHAPTRGGSEGELTFIKVNEFRNLIQNQLVIVTSQRPAGQAKSINSDTSSLKSARIGTAISEFYMSQLGFERKFVSATESALVCDEAFLDLFWDKNAGEPIAIDPETGQMEMSGEAMLRTHSTWNVARDPGFSIDQQDWYILSIKMNKFEAAHMYPKFYDEIVTCSEDTLPVLPMERIPDESDGIWGHLLIHDRTAAVPEGRYTLMVADKIVLDLALPYKDFPVERIAPSDVIEGCTGYSASNDLLALEEMTDGLHSVVSTNQITLGGQCIIGPEDSGIRYTDLAKGVRFFEVPPSMINLIKPLDLVHTPPEIFNYLGMLSAKKEQFLGINSVTLGRPEGQLSGASGSALALIQSQSISFNSGIQRSYFQLLSGVMTKLINVLRVYADTPKVAKIVGKSKASGLKEFKYTGEDLNSISSIVYEMVNPVSQTIGGRMGMAQDLLKAGQIKSPKQYINLVMTGQLDVLTEDDEADGLLILEENEALMEGRPVQAIATEMHADHIKSHMSVLSNLAAKQDVRLVQQVLGHVQDHINQWQQLSQSNPGFLMATGQQPLPVAPPPVPMPEAGPGISMHPSAPGIRPGPGGVPPRPRAPQHLAGMMGSGEVSPPQQKAQTVTQPNLPTIAGTQQKPVIPGVTVQ